MVRTLLIAGCRWLPATAAALGSTGALAWSGDYSIGVNSGYVLHGLSLGRDGPALQFSATGIDDADGWFGGISGNTLGAPLEEHQVLQVQGRIGRALRLSGDWGIQAAYSYYAYPLDRELASFEFDEAGLTFAYRDLVYLSVAHGVFKPWTMGHQLGLATDAVVSYPLAPTLAVTSALGYMTVDKSFGQGYAYGHLGMVWRIASLEATLSYIATSGRAKQLFGSTADDRWAGSVVWRF